MQTILSTPEECPTITTTSETRVRLALERMIVETLCADVEELKEFIRDPSNKRFTDIVAVTCSNGLTGAKNSKLTLSFGADFKGPEVSVWSVTTSFEAPENVTTQCEAYRHFFDLQEGDVTEHHSKILLMILRVLGEAFSRYDLEERHPVQGDLNFCTQRFLVKASSVAVLEACGNILQRHTEKKMRAFGDSINLH